MISFVTVLIKYYSDESLMEEGKNIFAFPQDSVEPGFHTYEAMIDTTRDGIRDNNQAGAFTLVYGRPRILLVGDRKSVV